ncbi:hypothetical protein DFJ63DRAFT_333758 [Scheffersomyces coipomensis]|uniref:uncharacterized protein n=1 Tax=Scheffersomyces coipomensis TaxID=1788519 RepID=UPI00315CD867
MSTTTHESKLSVPINPMSTTTATSTATSSGSILPPPPTTNNNNNSSYGIVPPPLTATSLLNTSTPPTNELPPMIPHSNSNDSINSINNNNTNNNTPTNNDSNELSNNPPRKRSKVSRACDACRRKKVRCNAEYSSTLQKVTKVCNNCIKNSENCSFSRVPLKRGPSKGYIRDLEEKLDKSTSSNPSSMSGATTSIQIQNTVIPITSSTSIHHQPLPFPQGHWKSNSTSNNTSSPISNGHNNNNNSNGHSPSINGNSSTIILPPIVGYQSKMLPSAVSKLSTNTSNTVTPTSTSNPSSPRSHSINGLLNNTPSSNPITTANITANNNNNSSTDLSNTKNSSPPIQGPFWKVPYEMPQSRSRRSSVTMNDSSSNSDSVSNDPNNNHQSHHHRRRSSIDSISSTSTNGSRLPSLKPSISVNSDVISDSDAEDFYSIKSSSFSLAGNHNRTPSINNLTRSRKNSQSLSPRNSVSSLSSLSGRMNKALHIQSNNSSTPTSLIPSPVVAPSLIPAHLQSAQQQQQQQQQGPPPPGSQPAAYPFPSYAFGSSTTAGPQPILSHPHPQFAFPTIAQVPTQMSSSTPTSFYQPTQYSKAPLNNIDTNLRLYYNHFHSSFPILPFNQNYIFSMLEKFDDQSSRILVDLFNQALNNLNNFKQITINDNISILSRILSLYPFNNFGIKVSDTSLILFFSSLLILNYTILLNGDIYSLGISLTSTIFNDFKVLENFIDFVNENHANVSKLTIDDYDNIKLLLPKLYFTLNIIDNLYSISFGIQKTINNNELIKFLSQHSEFLFPQHDLNDYNFKSGLLMFKNSIMLNDLILIREKFILNKNKHGENIVPINWQVNNSSNNSSTNGNGNGNTNGNGNGNGSSGSFVANDDFSNYFISLINEKFELIVYLLEINQFLSNSNNHDNEEVFENLIDYNLKLIRLIKKLSNSIITFANFISTSTQNNHGSSSTNSPGNGTPSGLMIATNSTHSPNSPLDPREPLLINPLLNITIGQLFKLIKLNKLIIDSLISLIQSANSSSSYKSSLPVANTSPNSSMMSQSNSAANINNLTGKSSSIIQGTGGDIVNRCIKINNDLSISFNLLHLNLVNLQLGSISINLIRNKISNYKFNFNLSSFLNNNGNGDLKQALNSWSSEFSNNILPFIERENIDGWY